MLGEQNMSNLAVDAALKASNFLNLINIHSKNVFDNIILNSDLNGAIVAGSQNAWNLFNGSHGYIMLQNNTNDNYVRYYYYTGWVNPWRTEYDNKSNLDVSYGGVGVRVLIKYRE